MLNIIKSIFLFTVLFAFISCTGKEKQNQESKKYGLIDTKINIDKQYLSEDKFQSKKLDALFGVKEYLYLEGEYSGVSFNNFYCKIIGLFKKNSYEKSYVLFFDNNDILRDTLNVGEKNISLDVLFESNKKGVALGKMNINNLKNTYFQITDLYELDDKKIKLKKIDLTTTILKCEIPIEYLTEEYVGIEDYFHFGTEKINKNHNQNSTIHFQNTNDNQSYIINLHTNSITPKSENIYFENDFLVIKKTFEDTNPHDIINYNFYFKPIQNEINLDRIEFTKETYVEGDDLCNLSYTYLLKNNISFTVDEINSFTVNNLKSFNRKLTVKEALDIVSVKNKYYQCTSSLDQDEIHLLLKEFPISSKTLNDYNNIAYFLQEKKSYRESLFLLKEILQTDPNRVVAWLNLADVQWALNNNSESKKIYQQYITLMKNQGKDVKKIPQRVYERSK